MNPLLSYGIQVIIISGLLYSYYHFVLRNKKFHRYNRFYLLGAALSSLLIPLLNIPVYFTADQTGSSVVYNTLTVLSGNSQEEGVIVYATRPGNENWFTLTHILQLVYITIAIVVFMRIIFSLLKINRIIRRHPVEKIDNIHFLNTEEPGTPFSFFRWLFWNRKIELNSAKGEQIFRHELFHIEQKHSLDILFLELLTVVGWFNPFFHLMKRETKAIHEFLADQFAVNENNRWDYAELLLMQVLNTSQRLVHPFFHNQIKRRIAMITSPQKTSHQYLRKLMVLPLTILSIFLFAFSYKEIKKEATQPPVPELKNSADTTIKPMRNVSVINKMVFISDSIIFRSAPAQDPKNNIPEAIAFMNGKRIFKKDYENKAIVCDSIEVYSADDKKAIEIYGPQARSGVMVIYNGKIIDVELKDVKEPEPEKIFTKVETEATFPGGSDKWRQYLQNNLNANAPVENNAPAGTYTVIVQFVVMKDGSAQDIRAITHVGYGLEEEAIRVITNGPKWLPAYQNGKAVNSYKKQPVTFIRQQTQPITNPEQSSKSTIVRGFITERVDTDPGSTPLFPGGDSAWRNYLRKNINALVPTDKGAPAGQYKIRIRFSVNPDGSLNDFTPLTNFGYGMEEEAIRVIKTGPKWIPVSSNGKAIRAFREQPITYVIEEAPGKSNTTQVIPDKHNSYILTVSELKNIDVYHLLQLPKGSEIISYTFSIDRNQDLIQIPNSGSQINRQTREQLNEATAGKLITIDLIEIRAFDEQKKEYYIKKIPSRVWYVKA
jgi:hypothetical protein